jgi:hypothetical protein
VTSTIGAYVLGAYLASLPPQLGTVAAIGQISGRTALLIMAASLTNNCAFNAYTEGPQVIALGQLVIARLPMGGHGQLRPQSPECVATPADSESSRHGRPCMPSHHKFLA